MKNKYYSLHKQDTEANLHIYGDITPYPWYEGDTSSYNLSQELQALEDVDNINVYINSYGGEVAEGLAIYNALKRHKAKITTVADGFACSIASVIFAAGDERVMSNTSLLMIHNAWTYASGDSNDLKEQAENLEKITQASINAYMNVTNVSEEDLKEMMNKDTWINGDEALEMGFTTKILEAEDKQVASQSVRKTIMQMIKQEKQEPEKTIVNNISLSKDDVEGIIKEQMKALEDKMLEKEQQNKSKDNKPLSMMRALLNSKEDI